MMYSRDCTTTPSPDSWSLAPESLKIHSNEVHVWRANLNVHSDRLRKYYQTLSTDERNRSARFKFQKDRDGYIAAHGILRVILSRYVALKPRHLRFCRNAFGKPSLDTSAGSVPIRYNMSHSQGLCLYAFSRDRDVGVDLEFLRSIDDMEAIARHFFSPQEVETLLALPGERQREAFYKCWTRKEAYMKARGVGLSLPLDRFDVSLSPDEPAMLLASREDPQELSRGKLLGFTPRSGFVAALAVEGHDWTLKYWEWSEE